MTRSIPMIAAEMVHSGLPLAFVLRAVEIARASEGVEDMLHLWIEEKSERDAIVAELRAALDDRAPSASGLEARDAERLLNERVRQKMHIRSLVETHGGVSRVAQAAGLPQPSLSRFLNTPSEPKPATLHRLATAMGLPVAALSLETTPIAGVYEVVPMRTRPAYRGVFRYGSTPVSRRLDRAGKLAARRAREARA